MPELIRDDGFLRCCLLLCLALDSKLDRTGLAPGQRVDEKTLRASLNHLRDGRGSAGSLSPRQQSDLKAVCADHPQLAVMVRSLPAVDQRGWIPKALQLYRALFRSEGSASTMCMALSNDLTRKLLRAVGQQLATQIWALLHELWSRKDLTHPEAGLAYRAAEALSGSTDPKNGTRRAFAAELLADTDALIADVVAGCEAGQFADWLRSHLRQALTCEPFSNPAAGCAGPTLADCGDAARHKPDHSAVVKLCHDSGGGRPAGSPADRVAARQEALLRHAALAVLAGSRSAEDRVAELLALEVIRRLVQSPRVALPPDLLRELDRA
jgi:hypothetical protein